jgi:single-strand DNA-binding protein
MAQLNRIILIGKIIDEPDLKVSTEGKSIAKFTIETERAFGDKTDRIAIVAWEKLADSVGEFSKNQVVLVEGRIQQRSFEDADKTTTYVTEVIASSLRSFSGGSVSIAGGKDQDITEDDIPF